MSDLKAAITKHEIRRTFPDAPEFQRHTYIPPHTIVYATKYISNVYKLSPENNPNLTIPSDIYILGNQLKFIPTPSPAELIQRRLNKAI